MTDPLPGTGLADEDLLDRHRMGGNALADLPSPSDIWEQNARIFGHEADTPMRGHDEDGACCRRAKFGVAEAATAPRALVCPPPPAEERSHWFDSVDAAPAPPVPSVVYAAVRKLADRGARLVAAPDAPPCPNCGHDSTGDPSRTPDGDHLVILQGQVTINQGEPGAAERLGAVVERNHVTFTATQPVRFAWCSTIDRSHL